MTQHYNWREELSNMFAFADSKEKADAYRQALKDVEPIIERAVQAERVKYASYLVEASNNLDGTADGYIKAFDYMVNALTPTSDNNLTE